MSQPSHLSSFIPTPPRSSQSLLSGIWLRWNQLTRSEQVICLNLVLLPIWWLVGLYRFMGVFFVMGIGAYELYRHERIRLKAPSYLVISLFLFCFYRQIGGIFFNLTHGSSLTLSGAVRYAIAWYPLCLLIWYIQSHNIRVRPTVVAWACSALVVEMLSAWVVVRYGIGEGYYQYPKTLFATVIGAGEVGYAEGGGLANFLIPYRYTDQIFAGLPRWSFFFIIPEVCALWVAFIALLSLSVKHCLWSTLLMVSALFLLLLSGTRSVWLSLPLILLGYGLFKLGQKQGFALPLALLALLSFTTLSVPSITHALLDTYTGTAEVVGSARADSTDVRSKIYEQTVRDIPNRLYFGHWVPGDVVLPGFELARVGTHSYILGTLLYRAGLVGLVLFLNFWIAFFVWLYRTRRGRPFAGFGLLALYTLVSPVMEFGELLAWMLLLLGCVIRTSPPAVGSGERGLYLKSRESSHGRTV